MFSPHPATLLPSVWAIKTHGPHVSRGLNTEPCSVWTFRKVAFLLGWTTWTCNVPSLAHCPKWPFSWGSNSYTCGYAFLGKEINTLFKDYVSLQNNHLSQKLATSDQSEGSRTGAPCDRRWDKAVSPARRWQKPRELWSSETAGSIKWRVSSKLGEKRYIPFDCCLPLFNVLSKRLQLSESLKDF